MTIAVSVLLLFWTVFVIYYFCKNKIFNAYQRGFRDGLTYGLNQDKKVEKQKEKLTP